MKKLIPLFCLLLLYGATLFAQRQYGGRPAGLRTDDNIASLKPLTLSAPDVNQLRREDADREGNRFAAAIPIDLWPSQTGRWSDLPKGGRRWQLRLRVPGALGLAVFYDHFKLPKGGRLFVYDPAAGQVLGAYTHANQPPSGRFWTGFIRGDEIVIEYEAPAGAVEKDPFHLWRIDYVYRPEGVTDSRKMLGFGAAADCHDNVNCPEGNDWKTEKKGVARIFMVVAEGTGYCTGTLLNNTAGNEKLYLLTAMHCQDGYTPLLDLWRFDFHYEALTCNNTALEPPASSILGCSLRASRRENDLFLLELSDADAVGMDLYFNGWSRLGTPPVQSTIIHHPRGDVQKIAGSTTPATVFPQSIKWNNNVTTPANHHYRLTYGYGEIEVGSSGSALFDQHHRVVGALHGAVAVDTILCNNITAGYFARLSMAWTGGGTSATRLSNWLDPLNSEPTFIDGKAPEAPLLGAITTPDGRGLGRVDVTRVVGEDTTHYLSDVEGAFAMDSPPGGTTVSLTLERDFDFPNGVSTYDIALIQGHIMQIRPLGDPYKILAADVNGDKKISVLDLIRIRKLVLNINIDFDGVPSWRFLPADYTFTNPNNPLGENLPYDAIELTTPVTANDLRFIAFKMGDVNDDAEVD